MQLRNYPVTRQAVWVMSPESLGPKIAAFRSSGFITSQAWRTAKLVVYIPFTLTARYYAAKLQWWNGSITSGNVDAGIMDAAGNRLYHGGTATAQTGTNGFQSFSPNIWLLPGAYYWALSLDNNTGRVAINNNVSTILARKLGMLQETTGSFGIPATWTPVKVTNGDVQWIGMTDDTTLTF